MSKLESESFLAILSWLVLEAIDISNGSRDWDEELGCKINSKIKTLLIHKWVEVTATAGAKAEGNHVPAGWRAKEEWPSRKSKENHFAYIRLIKRKSDQELENLFAIDPAIEVSRGLKAGVGRQNQFAIDLVIEDSRYWRKKTTGGEKGRVAYPGIQKTTGGEEGGLTKGSSYEIAKGWDETDAELDDNGFELNASTDTKVRKPMVD
ncbi:hypothetical protein PPACK8108_LOCUS8531 [Phakopsora pachyrhizi]|uniref:Uncharacterized protein n=1 Tax=Phakopsora pachyrhizi TaxID=170000 RepID=A0AAV0AYA8_PHAPC|nr:hypothetical protein PPACK8108_LOCUS8531 [Phakopsora pachyrhizi]